MRLHIFAYGTPWVSRAGQRIAVRASTFEDSIASPLAVSLLLHLIIVIGAERTQVGEHMRSAVVRADVVVYVRCLLQAARRGTSSPISLKRRRSQRAPLGRLIIWIARHVRSSLFLFSFLDADADAIFAKKDSKI
jgi:hypothetical protein